MHAIVNIAISAARQAGDIITQCFSRLDRINIRRKQNNDFVSDVDMRAEQAIIEIVHKAYPDHNILAEESGETTNSNNEFTWIIDPLDGTNNYVHGLPHFAVSIAVQQGDKIEHGVIYDPMRNEIFSASRGQGAYLNEKRIRVSKHVHLDSALIATGFPHRNKKLTDIYMPTLYSICTQSAGIRRAGAAALDLAYVASGRLEGYWEFALNSWDIAAGALIVKEAGGLVSDIDGRETFLQTGHIVAGNTKIFKALLQHLQPAVAALSLPLS